MNSLASGHDGSVSGFEDAAIFAASAKGGNVLHGGYSLKGPTTLKSLM